MDPNFYIFSQHILARSQETNSLKYLMLNNFRSCRYAVNLKCKDAIDRKRQDQEGSRRRREEDSPRFDEWIDYSTGQALSPLGESGEGDPSDGGKGARFG